MEKLRTEADSDDINASDAIAAILGSNAISLPGRTAPTGAQKMLGPFRVTPMALPTSPIEAMAQMLPAARKSRLSSLAFIAGCVASAGCIGFSAALFTQETPTVTTVSPHWRVDSLTEAGVNIAAGDGRVTIKIGELMPDGSSLKAISIPQHSYVTDAGIFILSAAAAKIAK